MPKHNTATASKKSAAGGADRTTKGLGKRAARAVLKGADSVDALLDALERGRLSAHMTLGRVSRVCGGSQYEVTLLEGGKVVVGLGGNIRGARGGCCVQIHDFVVVDGGKVKGRLTQAEASQAKRAVAEAEIRTPRNFFAVVTEDGDVRDETDDLFDYSDSAQAEQQERAALRAQMAREAALRSIPAGKQQKVVFPVTAAAAVEEPVVADVDVAEDEEVAEEPVATASVTAAPVPAAGPNRAARRAAKQAEWHAAQIFAEAAARREAYLKSLLAADEVDVDAI